jgi:hypothetical protein
MNTISWKRIAIGAVVLAIITFAVFYFIPSKGKREPTVFVDPAFAEFVSSYTAGVVGSGSAIRIVLTQEVVDESEVGIESGINLFSFSPTVKGKSIWLDKRTVEFQPDTRFVSGQRYEIAFNLARVMEVPEKLKSFVYSFQIIPQHFELAIDNIKPYVKTELTRQKIEGILFTSDYADNESVEKMINADQDGKSLALTWSHSGEGLVDQFALLPKDYIWLEGLVIEHRSKPLFVLFSFN